MLSRPRPDPSGVDPAQRMRELLALPSSGWLPPPLSEPADVDSALTPATSEPCDLEPLEHPSRDPSPVDPERSIADSRDVESTGLRGLLPPAVSTGRLDPGRRGAVALVLVAALAALVAGGVVLRGRPQELAVPQVLASGVPLPGVSPDAAPGAASGAPAGAEVVVAVAGEVLTPGLVRLPAGSRVDDAVRAAGGPLTPDAVGLLNLARLLVDGEQVLVGVEAPPGSPVVGPATADGLLDLNAATAADFEDLPGIGPVLAQRIVDWRTENGRFASVDQLREVSGIGEATFDELRSKVTV